MGPLVLHHVAGDGGFNLSDYPQVCGWIERLTEHPRHVPMDTETPLAVRSPAD
jgi:hypothetical protein